MYRPADVALPIADWTLKGHHPSRALVLDPR